MQCRVCGTAFLGRFCLACGWDSTNAMSLPPGSAPPAQESQTLVSPPPPPGFVAYRCMNCGFRYIGWYCPECGARLGTASSVAGLRATGSVVWTIGAIAFLTLLAVNLIAFAYATSLIVEGAIAGGPREIPLYLLLPFPWGESVDADPATFLAYFGFIAAVILAAYAVFVIRDTKATVDAFRRPLVDLRSRIESRSAWISTGQVFLAALFFQVVYAWMLQLAGFTPTAPPARPVPEWYPYFALANASVYEEFVTRWIFIGVPLVAWAAVLRKSRPSEYTVPAWRHLIGGTLNRDSPRNLVVVAMVLIVSSSVIFGLAHVPSWGWWKFLPAMVAGLGMGYLFVRRGLLAGVLFHFATDYLAATVLLTANNLAVQVLLVLFVLVLVGLGAFFFVWYFVYFAGLVNHWAVRWGFRRPVPTPTTPPVTYDGPVPWPYFLVQRMARPGPPEPSPGAWSGNPPAAQAPWFGGGFRPFVCPRCAWREAKYEDGRFTCLQCGHASP